MNKTLSRVVARRDYEKLFTPYVSDFDAPQEAAIHFRDNFHNQNGCYIFHIQTWKNGTIKRDSGDFTDADFFEKCKHLMG